MPTRKEVNCLTGEVVELELTQAELDAIAALPPPPGPTPLKQIRAIEAAKADDVAKVTRQALLMQTLTIALATPEAQAITAGMAPEQAKAAVTAYLVQTDPGFKLMWELEQAIEPLRAQIP
jgi:hypothetical protein